MGRGEAKDDAERVEVDVRHRDQGALSLGVAGGRVAGDLGEGGPHLLAAHAALRAASAGDGRHAEEEERARLQMVKEASRQTTLGFFSSAPTSARLRSTAAIVNRDNVDWVVPPPP